MRRLVLGVLVVAVLGTTRAAPVPEEHTWGTIPGGVVDAEGKTAYLACPGGTALDAVDLATGQQRWHTTAAERPLAVLGRHLAALASDADKVNVVRVVLLDIVDGKEVLRTEPIDLPDDIVTAPSRPNAPPLVPGRLASRTFACNSVADGKDLVVRWRYESRMVGPAVGRPPRPGGWVSAGIEGIIRVDRKSGAFRLLEAADLPAPKAPPEVEKAAGRVTIVGDRVFATARNDDVLLLRRWDLASGKPLDSLHLGKAYRLRAQVDTNGFVAVTNMYSPNVKEQDAVCWVFDLDGKQLASLPVPAQVRAVRVAAGRAFFLVDVPLPGTGNPESGNRVVVFDLATGKQLVSWPIDRERRSDLWHESSW
jgi:hypothetical protein